MAIDLAGLHTADVRLRVLRNLVRTSRSASFVILTRRHNRHLVQDLESPNVRNVTLAEPGLPEVVLNRLNERLPGHTARKRLARRIAWRQVEARLMTGPLTTLQADVMFCPFTPSSVRPGSVPLVAAVHDLSHISSPHLLTSRQRAARARAFVTTAERAARLLCSSYDVHEVARAQEDVSPERASTLWPGRLLLETPPSTATVDATLDRHGLRESNYWLARSRGEPRDNVALVLTAFGLFHARHPESDVELVFATERAGSLVGVREAIRRIGLERAAHVVEVTTYAEMLGLMAGSRAVVVPSLYDTLGDTLLQAMSLSKPVVASRLQSLVGIADDAAITFDPHRTVDLVAALDRLESDPGLGQRLIKRASDRVAAFEAPSNMTHAYLTVLRETRCQPLFR